MKAKEILKNIDWSELRNQKRNLLEVININEVNPEQKEGLEGIMALIDQLQDYACDEMNIPSIHVYDFEMEDKESEFKLDDKCQEIKTLNDINLTDDEKHMVMSLVNNYGSGQHPVCEEVTFNYFHLQYVDKLIKDNTDKIITNLNGEYLELFQSIKNKLQIV